jgi:hypothetical protein
MSPRSQAILLAALGLVLAGLLDPGSTTTAEPKDRELVRTTLHHHNHDHLWNRLHSALLIRVGPDGRAYGEDRLEPLLWLESDHLLKGKSADRAVAVLEEFVRAKGETLIEDSLKRALLQRDLWLVFNWLAKPDAADRDQPRQRLGALLAKVIRQLALSPEQIARLPDNYASAVGSKRFTNRFDPDRPDRAYLPPDLFKADGPWVCLGRSEGPTASEHLLESGGNRFTNSTFLIFLKFPASRDAVLDFLKRLAAFDKPLYLPSTDEKTRRFLPNLPNPALPQWPRGTEVALVRRALLIDSKVRVVASPLTESVQLRVMRTDTPVMTAKTVEGLYGARGTDAQAFAEFRLGRETLFAGEAGGLRDVSAERDFKTGFNSHPWDEFRGQRSPASTSGSFPERSQPFQNNRASCFGCHQYPGVYSFNSFHGDFPFTVARKLKDGRDGHYVPRSHSLAPMPVKKVEQAAVKWKQEQPGWKALRKLLPEDH